MQRFLSQRYSLAYNYLSQIARKFHSLSDNCCKTKYKILLAILMLLNALLFAYSSTYFSTLVYRQKLTNQILKRKHVNIYVKDESFLIVTTLEQKTYIDYVRNTHIHHEMRRQFGSNFITANIIFLEKNSFIIAAIENLLFFYSKPDKLNAAVGFGIPALVSLVTLIIRRKIFIKNWLKNTLILSFFVILFSCCSYPYVTASTNHDSIGFHGSIVLSIGFILFLMLIGSLGFEAGVIYVLAFLSVLLIDVYFKMSLFQFNIMFPYTLNGIGGAGFRDGLFVMPLLAFFLVLIGWLIRRTVLWGKRKYSMISKRRSDRRLASNEQQ